MLLNSAAVDDHLNRVCQEASVRRRQFEGADRRRLTRGASRKEPPRRELVATILSLFREMPGLSLQLSQAARLFALGPSTCRVVLEDLVRRGPLQKLPDGQYRLR
jgi:hypothetical protein